MTPTIRVRPSSPRSPTFQRLPKPILKRPNRLRLADTPFPFKNTKKALPMLSPVIASPHVQFAASPVVTAVFATHSANSYDRSSTKVEPNPLELPDRGDRVYSPNEDAFLALKSPAVAVPAPLVIINPAVAVVDPLKTVKPTQRPQELGKALLAFPRSPYPSAPVSSPGKENDEGLARAQSLDTKSKSKVGSPSLSPLLLLSPIPSSTRLTHAFWNALSLEERAEAHASAASVLETEEGSTPISAVREFVFGTRDGMMWSPGLPPKKAEEEQPLPAESKSASAESKSEPPSVLSPVVQFTDVEDDWVKVDVDVGVGVVSARARRRGYLA
ncbi:hypothetical protein MKEN_01238400 [Mycena kentingensis (nom. inval.)]|nr:hypothetical protein MKEN_01238400 [Mycena kentingensis (nom. inval.)]